MQFHSNHLKLEPRPAMSEQKRICTSSVGNGDTRSTRKLRAESAERIPICQNPASGQRDCIRGRSASNASPRRGCTHLGRCFQIDIAGQARSRLTTLRSSFSLSISSTASQANSIMCTSRRIKWRAANRGTHTALFRNQAASGLLLPLSDAPCSSGRRSMPSEDESNVRSSPLRN